MSGKKQKLAMLLITAAALTALTGCSNDDKTTAGSVSAMSAQYTRQPEAMLNEAPDLAPEEPSLTAGLSDTQRYSINMLNHLVVLTQEINASKNSRLYLEEAYSSLINNISPEVVDNRTLVEINYLLDTLERYRMINVKRDRLAYIYEQNKAQALRDALPNPLGLLSAVQSFDLSGLIGSVVYMAMDAYTSYESGDAQADLQYLQDGWALDDEEAAALHEIRKGTFNYMVETVRDYELPGSLALTEQAVADYVEWKNKTNNTQVIQFFEENAQIYQGFGPYWLTLAECYYENGDYDQCLQAIAHYQAMQNHIFRRDYAYARVLPLGIIAASHVYDEPQYVDVAQTYAQDILANTANTDWTLRYFAAQTCIDLYGITGETDYLREAYDIALNNVNYLIDEQKQLNDEYLQAVQEAGTPADATDAQKKEIKQYNKLLREERKTALPPVHEPLLLNCELLFSLAGELHISETEAARIDDLIHEDGEAIFLIEPLDHQYRMAKRAADADYSELIAFDGAKITLPARLVSEDAAITLTVTSEGEKTAFTDWTIQKVERKTEGDLYTFTATYASASAKKYDFKAGDALHIEIMPKTGSTADAISCDYNAEASKMLYVFDSVEFQRAEE